MHTPPTDAQQTAVIKMMVVVADTIRELSPVVSGHLYARLMSYNFSLADYEAIIGTLKRAGLVKESGHQLTWVGPAKGAQ
jgi:hypothetical protein